MVYFYQLFLNTDDVILKLYTSLCQKAKCTLFVWSTVGTTGWEPLFWSMLLLASDHISVIMFPHQLVDISDGYMTLLNNEGELREDLQVPKGTLGQKMEAKLEREEEVCVVVMQAMGEEATVGIRGTARRTELKPTSM